MKLIEIAKRLTGINCPFFGISWKPPIEQREIARSMMFAVALGQMRNSFGIMIGQMAKAYGLDVENELTQIIPE